MLDSVEDGARETERREIDACVCQKLVKWAARWGLDVEVAEKMV
jgi:hypothetical protein